MRNPRCLRSWTGKLPDENGMVATGRGETFAVRCKPQRRDFVLVSVKAGHFLPGIIPHANNTVPARCGDAVTRRRERDGADVVAMSVETSELFGGCRVPQANNAVPASGRR